MSEPQRYKDQQWMISPGTSGTVSWEAVHAAILMDLRDELKKLNALLHCYNFTAIPGILRDVARNTTPKKRRRKKARKIG